MHILWIHRCLQALACQVWFVRTTCAKMWWGTRNGTPKAVVANLSLWCETSLIQCWNGERMIKWYLALHWYIIFIPGQTSCERGHVTFTSSSSSSFGRGSAPGERELGRGWESTFITFISSSFMTSVQVAPTTSAGTRSTTFSKRSARPWAARVSLSSRPLAPDPKLLPLWLPLPPLPLRLILVHHQQCLANLWTQLIDGITNLWF